MTALSFTNGEAVKSDVAAAGCKKPGCMLWDEYLDYFFLRGHSLAKRMDVSDDWWKQIDQARVSDVVDSSIT